MQASQEKLQRRRIALPISSYLPNLGGMEVGLHNIASKLIERNFEPIVIAPAGHVKQLRQKGWNLPYQVKAFPPKVWSILSRAPALGFFVLDSYFAYMQRRYRFDFWHCTAGYPTGVSLIHFARKRQDIRYLIRCVGEDIQKDSTIGYGVRLKPGIDLLLRNLLPQSEMLIAISNSVREEYLSVGVDESRIQNVPNGVDLNRFKLGIDSRKIRHRYGLDAGTFLFISVGRNHIKKNYKQLIKATALLSKRIETDFRVLIVGRGASKLAEETKHLGVSDLVLLKEEIGSTPSLGCVPQLPSLELIELYLAADAFVFPSLLETFGVAIVEAMAASLPVIVGDTPGCRDVVRHGEDGIMVSPHDTNNLADEMRSLVENSGKRLVFSKKSALRAQDFSWDSVVDDYIKLYEGTWDKFPQCGSK